MIIKLDGIINSLLPLTEFDRLIEIIIAGLIDLREPE